MLGISIDLDPVVTDRIHPGGISEAFSEARAILTEHGFHSVQGNLYVTLAEDDENMAVLAGAMEELRRLAWFAGSARQVYAFRVESWSNFTDFMTSG